MWHGKQVFYFLSYFMQSVWHPSSYLKCKGPIYSQFVPLNYLKSEYEVEHLIWQEFGSNVKCIADLGVSFFITQLDQIVLLSKYQHWKHIIHYFIDYFH